MSEIRKRPSRFDVAPIPSETATDVGDIYSVKKLDETFQTPEKRPRPSRFDIPPAYLAQNEDNRTVVEPQTGAATAYHVMCLSDTPVAPPVVNDPAFVARLNALLSRTFRYLSKKDAMNESKIDVSSATTTETRNVSLYGSDFVPSFPSSSAMSFAAKMERQRSNVQSRGFQCLFSL